MQPLLSQETEDGKGLDLCLVGNIEKARQTFEETATVPGRDYVTAVDFAKIIIVLWETSTWRFEMLDRAFENHDPELCTIRSDLTLRAPLLRFPLGCLPRKDELS